MNTFSEIITLTFLCSCIAILVGHACFLWKLAKLKNQTQVMQCARGLFRLQRELLEAKFVTYANTNMDPSLWVWDDADFGNEVLIARNKKKGALFAYMPVTVEMNRPIRHTHLPKNSLFLRQVTVIFQFSEEANLWQLTSLAFFNQSPSDIIQRRGHEFHLVSSLVDPDDIDFQQI